MQEHDSAVSVGHGSGDDCAGDALHGGPLVPLIRLDVPADMPVTPLGKRVDQASIVRTGAERAAKPGMWVDAGCLANRLLRSMQVFGEPLSGEERHPRVVVGVAADQVSARDPARQVRIGLHPSALEEERGIHAEPIELVQELDGAAGLRRAIRVLGVEGQRNPETASYFSTPVITTPRMKTRWNIRNRITGTMRVISVPAWMRPGSWAERLALNVASPTARVWRSGLVDR